MTTYAAVTSFSPKGWTTYGKRFVESFLQYWPIDLHVYAETKTPEMRHAKLTWHYLKDDAEHETFCAKYSAPEYNSPTDFNMMSVKFCHKVFAITTPIQSDWRIWIDADAETVRPVTQDDIRQLFPPPARLTFLGRKGFMRPGQPMYSECGFVGYRVSDCRISKMLANMRAIYVTGALFRLGPYNWHDSYVFDYCRKQILLSDTESNDLSRDLPPQTFHPWPHTILGTFMIHAKGPRRKLETYGSIA